MKKLTPILACLCLAIILTGCAGKQPIIQTETIRMYPPPAFVRAIPEPIIPPIPDVMDTGQLLDWMWLRGEIYRQAWQESEADKAQVRKWMQP